MSKGLNKIKISTGIECQGLYEDNYLNSFEVKYAPNPIDNYLDLYFGGNDDFIEIGIYTVNGQLIDMVGMVSSVMMTGFCWLMMN